MKINGKRVVDATKPVRLHVLPDDVKRGDNKNPSSCAAARAAIREGVCTKARVHLGRTYLEQGDKWVRYMTGRPLRTEIISFDRGAQFQPGEFTLYKMTPTKKATGKAQGSLTNKTTKKKRKVARVYHNITGVRAKGAAR